MPFNDAAMEVVQRQKGKHFVKVFTYEGEPVRQVSTKAWYKALKRAGIEDFRWHDLRHTWASWHGQGGTPLFALQELAGWETEKMVRRYAHLAAEHLAVYAANTEKSRHKYGTTTGFPRHSPITTGWKIKNFVVARGGIEPPTRGFSVHCPKQAKLPQ